MDRDTFLLQDYQSKINYLTNHFTRMWTRFNFFLTINSALFGFSFNQSYAGNETSMAVAGMVFSALWCYFGAVDNFLADLYRAHVQTSFALIKDKLTAAAAPGACCPPEGPAEPFDLVSFVGDTRQRDYYTLDETHRRGPVEEVGRSLWGFRWSQVSATDLATLFPVVFFLAWVIRLVLASDFDWPSAFDRLF